MCTQVLISASAIPEPNYFYTTEAALQHVNYFNSLLTDLEKDLSQNLFSEMMFSNLNVNIERYRADVERAFSIGAINCIFDTQNLNDYEEQAYLNLKQCEKQVTSENFKEITYAANEVIVKIQEIESKTKILFDTCAGDQSCDNKVLADNQLQVEQLFWGEKKQIDDLFTNTKSVIFNYFHLCVEDINNPLLTEIVKKNQDLKTCIETPIDV